MGKKNKTLTNKFNRNKIIKDHRQQSIFVKLDSNSKNINTKKRYLFKKSKKMALVHISGLIIIQE